jgi:hypothetical protein
MKRINYYLLSAVFVILISGCKSEEEKQKEAAENLIENLIENVTDQNIDINVDKAKESSEITINGENGESVTVTNNEKTIPKNFPDDVYLVKGNIETAGSINSQEGELITISIFASESFNTLVSDIKKQMEAKAWKSTMNMTTGTESVQIFTKNKNSATITIANEDKVTVNYLVSVSKK